MFDTAYDVVVIGAGPAGSAATRSAALAGASVLLVDKARFPRAKVCGCCVNRAALASLRRLGLDALCNRLEANPLHHGRWWTGGSHARVPLRGGVAVSRAALDSQLAQAAVEAGARFVDGASAHVVDQGWVEVRRDGQSTPVHAGMIVCADGLAGRSLAGFGSESSGNRPSEAFAWRVAADSFMGFGTKMQTTAADIEPGLIEMACGSGGYVGLVRLEDGRVDIAGAMNPTVVRETGGPAQAAAATLDQAGMNVPDALEQAHWTGTPQLTRQRMSLAGAGVLVVGDAAGYVEPFTGEGIAWALAGGLEAGALAAGAAQDAAHQADYENRWASQYRRLIGRRQWPCRLVASALRRPSLTHGLVRTISRHPSLAKPVIHRIAS